jgi:hypothetical protein
VRSRCVLALNITFVESDSHYNSIIRAFLIEEAKVVKRVIKSQQKVAGGRS